MTTIIDELHEIGDQGDHSHIADVANKAAAEIKLLNALLQEFLDAARVDPLMSGPVLAGFNQSDLRRLWPKVRAQLEKK